MGLVSGENQGGQLVWKFPDDTIVPVRILIDTDGNEIPAPVRKDMEGGGKISVGITAIEVTFSGTPVSIIISADILNTGTLYIGKSEISSNGNNSLIFLEAGENITIEYEDGDNPVFVVASIINQNFFAGALL